MLSIDLQRKIANEIKYQETTLGTVKQFVFGLLLPAGLLLGDTWDMDMDVNALRGEVANTLAAVFSPSEYRLIDTVQEGKFSRKGRVLLTLIF